MTGRGEDQKSMGRTDTERHKEYKYRGLERERRKQDEMEQDCEWIHGDVQQYPDF